MLVFVRHEVYGSYYERLLSMTGRGAVAMDSDALELDLATAVLRDSSRFSHLLS